MKIVGVIPIKLNNKRLPGKNTNLLGDAPLIRYILQSLEVIQEIDNIYLYCSEDKIINYFNDMRTKFLKRPEELDSDNTNFTQIFESFVSEIDADIYIYAHATAPFIKQETITECVDKVVSGAYDSAFTAVKIQDFLWQDNNPLNFDSTNIPRSQDLAPVYRETSGIYVFKKEVFTKYRRRIGIHPYIKEVGYKESIDINYPEDMVLAEAMLRVEL